MSGLPETALKRIRAHLVGLKMSRALEAVDACVRRVEGGELSALEFLDELLGEEQAIRESWRIKSSLMTARLTRIKTLDSFDFSLQPSLDKNRILALVELRFIERGEVVHLLCPPGTGKSHLAIVLGVEAVKARKSFDFATLAEIIDSLRKAEREGKLAQRIDFITRVALLIVDEVGYLPV
jgi:DNA replication protein DnaC